MERSSMNWAASTAPDGANAEPAPQAEAIGARRDDESRRLRGWRLRKVGHDATSVLDDAGAER
ncbi:MAG: hypothetical protein DLM70_03515 [Chloroflexi bacterium]|nr:MAG: hypothetical protein DLM70_03515 [Chloroflexota bacterium]